MEIKSPTTLLTKKEKKKIQARVKVWARERNQGSRETISRERCYKIQVLEGILFHPEQE